MSLHTDLDIYKSAEAFFELALAMQKHVPREFRLVVGQRISGLAADILLQVARANKAMGDSARLAHLAVLAEQIEAATGLLGALLLAINGKHAGYGWLAFLASNAAWLHFAWRLDYAGLLAQTIGFTLTNPKINQPPTGGATCA